MLEQCWVSQPNNRPNIEDVRQRLETSSNLLELPSPEADVGVEDDSDGWDSGRKTVQSFTCPVPGCESTFTTHSDLKRALNHYLHKTGPTYRHRSHKFT